MNKRQRKKRDAARAAYEAARERSESRQGGSKARSPTQQAAYERRGIAADNKYFRGVEASRLKAERDQEQRARERADAEFDALIRDIRANVDADLKAAKELNSYRAKQAKIDEQIRRQDEKTKKSMADKAMAAVRRGIEEDNRYFRKLEALKAKERSAKEKNDARAQKVTAREQRNAAIAYQKQLSLAEHADMLFERQNADAVRKAKARAGAAKFKGSFGYRASEFIARAQASRAGAARAKRGGILGWASLAAQMITPSADKAGTPAPIHGTAAAAAMASGAAGGTHGMPGGAAAGAAAGAGWGAGGVGGTSVPPGGGGIGGGMAAMAAGLASGGMAAAAASAEKSVDLLKKILFATWDYIDQKVLPTQSKLNQALGVSAMGMHAMNAQAMTTGNLFERLGLGFEKGTQEITDFATALRTDVKIPDSDLKTLLTLSEYVGVGAKEAANLARSFQATGGTIGTVRKVMEGATKAQEKYRVPANVIRREFADNIDIVQRWSIANSSALIDAIGKANQYGFSIRDLNATFGEAFDTFEHSSEVAAKLNQQFGTSIDSIKLMTAPNEERRWEMIRKAMEGVGVVWDKLERPQKNFINNLLHTDNAMSALYLGSQKTISQARRQREKTEENARATEKWDDALFSLKRQIVSMDQLWQNLFLGISNVVAAFLGMPSNIEGTMKTVELFEVIIRNISDGLNKFAEGWRRAHMGEGQGGILDFFAKVAYSIQSISASIDAVIDKMQRMQQPFDVGVSNKLEAEYSKISPDDKEGLARFREKLMGTHDVKLPGAAPGSTVTLAQENYEQDVKDLFYDRVQRHLGRNARSDFAGAQQKPIVLNSYNTMYLDNNKVYETQMRHLFDGIPVGTGN